VHFIGVDHHKQTSTMTVLDSQGREVRTARLLNLRVDIEAFIREMAPEGFLAVVEAGRASYGMTDLLRELGGQVKMANPLQVKAIAHARIKTDKRDSRTLAQLLRADLIPEVYQREAGNREAQRVLRLRAFWMSLRVQVRNKIRALLAQQSEEVRMAVEQRSGQLFGPKGQELLRDLKLGDRDGEILGALFRGYQTFQAESDELVAGLYRELPAAQLIDTAPGFATTFSVLVAVEIAEVRRFPRVEALHSYAGLIPSTYSSGARTYHGHIIKGNVWLRWALIEAVYPAIRKDAGLSILYHRLARTKGPNVAKVAAARRLLTILYRMLTENRAYVPYRTNPTAA
jgi:transposase